MAAEPQRVMVLKAGNRLAVEPTTVKIAAALKPLLSYVINRTLHGPELREAMEAHKARVEFVPVDCFEFDIHGRLVTSWGFHHAVRKALVAMGYIVDFRDLRPHPNPAVYEPDWSQLEGVELRHKQDEFLVQIATESCGKIDCPPGYGKSFMVGLVGKVFREARIDVITKRLPVLKQRLYKELSVMLPSVGICCSGHKRLGCRVMCYSVGSLDHAEYDADIVIADEGHELAADSYAPRLARYEQARMFSLSASHNMRRDGRDPRLEALFGPTILSISRKEAQAHSLVVPVEVIWRSVRMDMDPCSGLVDVAKARHGIWRNGYRNALIRDDARLYPDDEQVLITVETIEHAVNLKRLLPEFTLVHAAGGMAEADRARYIRSNHLTEDEPILTAERAAALANAFEKNTLKKVIATTVWNVGVDFKHLTVLIRADAGPPGDRDVQIPGRTSRIVAGKVSARIHDYLDEFNTGYRVRATGRKKNYDDQGFVQRLPAGLTKGSMAQRLFG